MKFSRMQAYLLALVSLPLAACNADPSDSDDGGASGEAGATTGGTAGSASGGRGGSGGAAQGGNAGSPGGGGTGGVVAGCAAVTPWALVTFAIGDETLRVGVQNDAFVDEATRLLETDETRVPMFSRLIDGTGCDAQWSWHPDPQDLEFADFTIELCDGTPSYIEENKSEWLATVVSYCPWSARVTEVTVVDPP